MGKISPFIYLGVRKWKKHLLINWVHITAGYIMSFLIYAFHVWVLSNTSFRQSDNIFFREFFIVIPLWSLLVFYCSKLLVVKPYSIWHFLISLAISIVMFCSLIAVLFYAMVVALGYIGRNYF